MNMTEKLMEEAGKDICLRNLVMIISRETILDEAVEALIRASKRTLSEAYDYVKDAARKNGRHGLITVSKREVYEWICEFYNLSEDKYQQLTHSGFSEKKLSMVAILPVKIDSSKRSKKPEAQIDGQMNIYDYI